MSGLFVQDYSEKAIVVRGEKTKDLREDLKTLGGKWNGGLRGGGGWIFPKNNSDKILKFVEEKNGSPCKIKERMPPPFSTVKPETKSVQPREPSLPLREPSLILVKKTGGSTATLTGDLSRFPQLAEEVRTAFSQLNAEESFRLLTQIINLRISTGSVVPEQPKPSKKARKDSDETDEEEEVKPADDSEEDSEEEERPKRLLQRDD